MHRFGRVLLSAGLLLPALAGSSAIVSAASHIPPTVPCLLTLRSETVYVCYSAAAVADLYELAPNGVNPAPVVAILAHLPLRQLMSVGWPNGGGLPYGTWPIGLYFVFGTYVYPTEGIPNFSPAEPKWLIVIEGTGPPATTDVPFYERQWWGGPTHNGVETGWPTTQAWMCQAGGRCAQAMSNEPVPLLQQILTLLSAPDRRWRSRPTPDQGTRTMSRQ